MSYFSFNLLNYLLSNLQLFVFIFYIFFFFQVSGANDLIIDEYLKNAQSPEDIRDQFTQMIGDLLMVVPVLKAADYHRGEFIKNEKGGSKRTA